METSIADDGGLHVILDSPTANRGVTWDVGVLEPGSYILRTMGDQAAWYSQNGVYLAVYGSNGKQLCYYDSYSSTRPVLRLDAPTACRFGILAKPQVTVFDHVLHPILCAGDALPDAWEPPGTLDAIGGG